MLRDIDLELEHGAFLALMGPSGSGKSTLLNIVGLLDKPTSGRLFIKGDDTGALTTPPSRNCAATRSVSCSSIII